MLANAQVREGFDKNPSPRCGKSQAEKRRLPIEVGHLPTNFVEGASRHNLAVLEVQQLIGLSNRGQPVGDGKRGDLPLKIVQGADDRLFSLSIQC